MLLDFQHAEKNRNLNQQVTKVTAQNLLKLFTK